MDTANKSTDFGSTVQTISQKTLLDSTFNHLFNCTDKVFRADGCESYTELQTDMPRPSDDDDGELLCYSFYFSRTAASIFTLVGI